VMDLRDDLDYKITCECTAEIEMFEYR
jgi:hypothetical protein